MTPQLKLGKKEAKKDDRNFRMAALLKKGNVGVQALDAMLEKVNPVVGCNAI